MTTPWARLDAALDAFARRRRMAQFWWRDDDAEIVTPELERLATRAERYRIPLALAVIPAGASKTLGDILAIGKDWTALVHGFSHKNHAPDGAKRAEFGSHRLLQRMSDELRMGRDRLHAVLPDHARSVLVPPWNRIAPDLLLELESIGFTALSAFGPRPPGPVLPTLNCHLDVMNWRTRKFAGADVMLDTLVALLAVRRTAPEAAAEPIGILTHHRKHDRAAEAFLDKLAARLSASPAVRWLGVDDALATPVPAAATA